jgi:hypothetical protein
MSKHRTDKIRPVSDDSALEDTEAHGFRMGAAPEEEDTEGHGLSARGALPEDDDTEGHARRM